MIASIYENKRVIRHHHVSLAEAEIDRPRASVDCLTRARPSQNHAVCLDLSPCQNGSNIASSVS